MRNSQTLFVSFESVFSFFKNRNDGHAGQVLDSIEIPKGYKLEIQITPLKTKKDKKRGRFYDSFRGK